MRGARAARGGACAGSFSFVLADALSPPFKPAGFDTVVPEEGAVQRILLDLYESSVARKTDAGHDLE